MDSHCYEKLCQLFIAEKEGIPTESVKSSRIKSMHFCNLPTYRHQIDLYWELETEISRYLNIAEVKWRSKRKVTQETVIKIQQVKQDLAAHKAIVITNTDFTDGAKSIARNKRIALHIVTPQYVTSTSSAKRNPLLELLEVTTNKLDARPDCLTPPKLFKLDAFYIIKHESVCTGPAPSHSPDGWGSGILISPEIPQNMSLDLRDSVFGTQTDDLPSRSFKLKNLGK